MDDSLAEMHIHENLLNLARLADPVFRVFNEVVANLREDKDISRIYMKINEPKNRVEETRVMFMEYLIRLGETITHKHSYINLALGIDRATQLLDGASYRLSLFRTKGYIMDDELYDLVAEFASTIVTQYNSFVEALDKLRSDPKKALISIKEVVQLENKADELYRHITFTLYSKYADQIVPLMILKDAIEFIENTADTIKFIGEELRYLALYRVLIS